MVDIWCICYEKIIYYLLNIVLLYVRMRKREDVSRGCFMKKIIVLMLVFLYLLGNAEKHGYRGVESFS